MMKMRIKMLVHGNQLIISLFPNLSYFTEAPLMIVDPSLFDCSWATTTGYVIDVSQLYGTVLSYSPSKSQYTFCYSPPCNDSVICMQNSGNVDTTAIQDDETGFCMSHLANYGVFVEPVYSPSSETFTLNNA